MKRGGGHGATGDEQSKRDIATAMGAGAFGARSVASSGTVTRTEARGTRAGLDWATCESLDDATLERRLFGDAKPSRGALGRAPDPTWIDAELRRKGVTLELLHLEYLRENPNGLRITAFGDAYRRWRERQGITMRQHHHAGEKCFVDYSRKKPCIVDPATGEVSDVELFVATLGASNMRCAEATMSQKIGDFISSHARAFEYFGGAARVIVPDQLRSAVAAPSRYEPTIARAYADFGRHYGVAIVPARPAKPRDKAKVEVAVQVVQSRRELFERVDRRCFTGEADLLQWAADVGPMTEAMVKRIFDARSIREHGWRSAKGIQRLAKTYGEKRVEAACAQAIRFGAQSYKPIERVLALGRESLPTNDTSSTQFIAHENVRGADYFQ